MASTRPSRHRGLKGSPLGPIAGARVNRGDEFALTVSATLDYLKTQWPTELSTTRVEIHAMPPLANEAGQVPRWTIFRDQRLVWLYRIPIERLSRLHKRDLWHRRMLVESYVISALAELLGTDPWDLAPERFHPH